MSTITDSLKEDLTSLYYTTRSPEFQEEWKETMRRLVQVEPKDEHLLDEIITKLHRQLTGTPEPLPLHVLLMIDGLADEELVKRIGSLGHLENYLMKNFFFTGAFLTYRDRALDDAFLALDQSDITCVIPFLGY